MTFQLVYWGTYKQIHLKINLPVYLHASLSSNHEDLPVTTTTCVHVHRCTRSGPYPFIFILSFQLTVKIYPSTVLLFYMSTDLPVHHLFGLFLIFLHILRNDLSTHLLGYLPTDPPEFSFYLFTFMLLFRLTIKTYLSPQLYLYLPIDVPVHGPTCSFSYFHSD